MPQTYSAEQQPCLFIMSYQRKVPTIVDSGFYPQWDGRMSIRFCDELRRTYRVRVVAYHLFYDIVITHRTYLFPVEKK